MIKWVLKKGEDRRLRAGHPWVFSNELLSSPKGYIPGEQIEIFDQRGHFLARGYGNPNSLIAFRALTWVESEKEIFSSDFILNRLKRAWSLRWYSGLKESIRLCFGESDGLPGLVVDFYLTRDNPVFALQILTAGMQRAMKEDSFIEKVFSGLLQWAYSQKMVSFDVERLVIVIRNDVNIRKLEGLEVEMPRVLVNKTNVNLNSVEIAIDSLIKDSPVWMNVDLIGGQKTGFFLDQRGNIFQILNYLAKSELPRVKDGPLRILDLCCYVGHWSSQIGNFMANQGKPVEVDLVDVSANALSLAKKNVTNNSLEGSLVRIHEMNVLDSLDSFTESKYDIVICDPPAFIKAKKDIPTGSHAYLKLNTHAFRLTAHKGITVSCSCSGLMGAEPFRDILRKSQSRNSMFLPTILVGGHSPDHPTILTFPEGFYLKMFAHLKI